MGRSTYRLPLLFLALFGNPSPRHHALPAHKHMHGLGLEGHVIWIQDMDDWRCLGPEGFSECGDANLWCVSGVPGDYMLEHVALHLAEDESDSTWLDRAKCKGIISSVRLGKRSHCGALGWDLDLDGRLSHKTTHCVVRKGNKASMQDCDKGHTPLTIVPLTARTRRKRQHTNDELSAFVTLPEWSEPVTGLQFPGDTSHILGGDPFSRQVLMGGGVFTRTVLKIPVYAMGWYVEFEAAAQSPELQRFKGKDVEELVQDDQFYNAMVAPAKYDRTLMIKLALTLRSEALTGGMMDTLLMEQDNKELLLSAASKHDSDVCRRGMELVFTWKKDGTLEIRIDGHLIDTLSKPGLAQDFFTQYVNHDPISPHAKRGFVSGFPDLLVRQAPTFLVEASHIPAPSSSIDYVPKPKKERFMKRIQRRWRQILRGMRNSSKASYTQTLTLVPYLHPHTIVDYVHMHAQAHMRHSADWRESVMSALILLYCLLLILLSLPPSTAPCNPSRRMLRSWSDSITPAAFVTDTHTYMRSFTHLHYLRTIRWHARLHKYTSKALRWVYTACVQAFVKVVTAAIEGVLDTMNTLAYTVTSSFTYTYLHTHPVVLTFSVPFARERSREFH